MPGLSNGVVLWNSANPASFLAWRETESAGRQLGVKLKSQEVRSPRDFGTAFAEMAEQRPEVLLVIQGALTLEYRKDIIDFALQQ
jgi:putative ABC transport system substrate-binding protein